MKKTCLNCKHFHACLSEEEISAFPYHIHNYCDKFSIVLTHHMESEVNKFLLEHWYTMERACSFQTAVNDDFETGEAFCWMFKEGKAYYNEEWYKANKKHNIEIAIKTLEFMFEKQEVYDDDDWYTLDEYYNKDEINYFKDLLERLKKECVD